MEFWSEVTSFAEEAAKRSHERPQGLAAQVLYRADLIKSLSLLDSLNLSTDQKQQVSAQELERFGINGEFTEFVKEITMTTFQDFPHLDDAPMSDVPKVSNVWEDLTEWQAQHATLMLSNVKEISKLHYELCPRFMNERKFWRIYFVLVNSHIASFETRYNEAKLKAAEAEKEKEAAKSIFVPKVQDLDALMGDLGDRDEGSDNEDYTNDGDDASDDDFNKTVDSSDDEHSNLVLQQIDTRSF